MQVCICIVITYFSHYSILPGFDLDLLSVCNVYMYAFDNFSRIFFVMISIWIDLVIVLLALIDLIRDLFHIMMDFDVWIDWIFILILFFILFLHII